VDLVAVRSIGGDTWDCDCCGKAVDELFLERVDTLIRERDSRALRIKEFLLIRHFRSGQGGYGVSQSFTEKEKSGWTDVIGISS
jgi:hypothetical protein